MEKIKEINLMPVSISYEFDPNDYLKAREFLLRRRNPDFKSRNATISSAWKPVCSSSKVAYISR